MKRILFILFVLVSVTASAQWTIINGNQRFAKGLGIPTKDTFNTYTLADTSQIVLRPQDSALYVHYKGRWQKIGGGGTGGVGTLQQVTDLGNTTTNAIKINSNIYNHRGVEEKIKLTDTVFSNTIDMSIKNYFDSANDRAISTIKASNSDRYAEFGLVQETPFLTLVNGNGGYNSTFNTITQNSINIHENEDNIYITPQDLYWQGFIDYPTRVQIKPLYINEYYSLHPHTIYTPLLVSGVQNDTLATLRNVRAGGGSSTDTTSLSNRINLKLDSLKRSRDSVYGYKLGVKYFQYKDSIGSGSTDTTSLSNRINTKLNTSDSSIYQTKYRSDTARINTYTAINNKLNTSDTLSLSSRIDLKLNKSDSTIYYTKYRSDTSRTNIYVAINGKISDTTSLQSKTLAAYSFQANKTNVNATATANTFKDTSGTYTPGTTGTVTWSGTAPTSLSNGTFKYTQIGKMCTISITLLYASGGANSSVDIVLPSFCATPDQPGFTSTNDFLYAGSGMMSVSTAGKTMTSTNPNANRACYIKKNASGQPSMVITAATSGTVTFASGTIIYYTN